jgi:Transposase domain (DUF772)
MSAAQSRSYTKSPLSLAREALAAGRAALPGRHSRFSRLDFAPAQLFAVLVLRQFFKTDYRGICRLLADLPDLRAALGLAKVPHYSTLCYAERRLVEKGRSPSSWRPRSSGRGGAAGSARRGRWTPRGSRAGTPRGITRSGAGPGSGGPGSGGRS